MDKRHLRSECSPRLAELDPDNASAENRKPGRHLGCGCGLDIRPRFRLAQPVDLGHEGTGASRDHDRATSHELLVAYHHTPLSGKSTSPSHERDAALFEPRQLARVIQVPDHVVASAQDSGHVNRADLESGNPLHLTEELHRPKQRL